jgi:AGZA family xanthine/uracil permease-like MFS transporter
MFLEKWFQLGRHHTTVKKELLAGLTTFSTMAYVMVVNPLILSDAGVDFASAMSATILISFLATLIMGLYANYPFALAPGLGMSAYFTYSVVLGQKIDWPVALGVVFLAGIILLFLWVFRLRELIIHAIPQGLKVGATAGVGLFLVVIGLKNANIIVSHPQTLLALGDIQSPEAILSAFGVIVIAALMARNVQGAILISILLNWAIGLAWGLVKWKGILAWPQFPSETFLKLDIQQAFSWDLWTVVLSFLFICLFDTAGSLMGLAHQGRFLDKDGKLPRLRRVLLPDSIGTTLGALLGTSASVVYIESASGVAAGGRTGLSVVLVSFLFLVSLFFAPLASSIPLFAITPVLLTIGALMMRSVTQLNWEDPSDFIPCFITVVGIPLTYSIGVGIGLGMLLYPICKLLAGKAKEVHWLAWLLAALFAFKFAYS